MGTNDDKGESMNKKTYDVNYIKTNCKQIVLMLNKNNDKDIIDFLSALSNKNGYLKELIRKDMIKKEGKKK